MVRWEPDSRSRLEQAAMALYAERGFENTTVAAIAERAGLTERTFFRHFADKREVLFAGAGVFQEVLVGAVEDAAQAASPIDAALAGLNAAGALFPGPALSRQRQRIISASEELRERELIKMASLTQAVAEALRRRGVDAGTASLTAEFAIAVFRIAFERWIDEHNEQGFPELVQRSLEDLKALAATG